MQRHCRRAAELLKQHRHRGMASSSVRRAFLHSQPPPHLHSATAPCCSTPAAASGDAFSDPQMSVVLVKALKKALRKKKIGQRSHSAALWWPSTNSCLEVDWSCRIPDLQGTRSCRHRLNWNPLLLGPVRQLSVRHNTQTAQTPPTSPNATPALLLTSSVAHPTVPSTSNARRAFLVDTLAVMRRLEAQELNQRQAEAITSVVTTVLNDSLESVAQAYTSKADMQKCEMVQDATLSKFKAEMQSSLEHHFATLQRESERLRTDMEKMRSELRYEIDKVQANQRLDLNLERGHIRDELNKQQTETSTLSNKIDREIHSLKTQLEAAKYDVIKYCIGTIVSVTALGLGLLRIIM